MSLEGLAAVVLRSLDDTHFVWGITAGRDTRDGVTLRAADRPITLALLEAVGRAVRAGLPLGGRLTALRTNTLAELATIVLGPAPVGPFVFDVHPCGPLHARLLNRLTRIYYLHGLRAVMAAAPSQWDRDDAAVTGRVRRVRRDLSAELHRAAVRTGDLLSGGPVPASPTALTAETRRLVHRSRQELICGNQYVAPEEILRGRLEGLPPAVVLASHARAFALPRAAAALGDARLPNGVLADWWDDQGFGPAVSHDLRRWPLGVRTAECSRDDDSDDSDDSNNPEDGP